LPIEIIHIQSVRTHLEPEVTVFGYKKGCVYHAVMGFYLRNYWTVVVTDGVYCRTDEGRDRAFAQYSEPSYPNIFLSRSDLSEFSADPDRVGPRPRPGQ
jgi:hypothetical protein